MKTATKNVGDKIGSWTVKAVVASVAKNDACTTFIAICEKSDPTRTGNAVKRTRFDVTSK